MYVTESLRLQGEGKYIIASLDEVLHPRVSSIDAEGIVDAVASKLEEE